MVLVLEQHLSWLAALSRTDDASCLQLVHESAGTVVADAESALYHARAALLGEYDGMGCILEVRVEVAGVHTA